MKDNANPNGKSRRSFLKRSMMATGAVSSGLIAVPGVAVACSEPKGNYEENNYSIAWGAGDTFDDSICDDGSATGTKIGLGNTAIYWGSEERNSGIWSHHFSNHSYAEHYTDEYPSCEWEHSPGISQQRWSARELNSSNGMRFTGDPNGVGVYPEVDGNNHSFSNIAFTGLTIAIGTAFPATRPAMSAAALVNALQNDTRDTDTPLWDKRHSWDHTPQASCAGHHLFYFSEGSAPDSDKTHVETEDWFFNDFGFASVKSNMEINDPWTSSTSNIESNTHTVGEIIDIEGGQEAKVTSVKDQGFKKVGGGSRRVDEQKYKEQFPTRYAEMGAPERVVSFPARGKVTTITGKLI